MLGRRSEVAVAAVAALAIAAAAVISIATGGGAAGALDALAWIAALATAPTLGLAGCAHAIAMRRMQRVRLHDVGIAMVGIASLVVALAAMVLALVAREPSTATALLHACWPAWTLGLAFDGYLLHVAASRPRALRAPPASILVLGGALQGRHVGPLLRRRVDRAAELWHVRGDPAARVVVCGGQGHDEPRSEAEAMAEHLVSECGVPASAIDLEDASTSTEENLAFARSAVGAREPWLVVTSEYHVPRTRVLLDRLGVDGDAIGSWSSPAYRPGALVRELAATLRASRVALATVGVLGAAIWIAGLVRAVALASAA